MSKTYDPHGTLPLETRRRRLVFRAWHRGIKEVDLIMGNFVEKNITDLGEDDCAWFERLFEEQDQDILNWVTGDTPVPEAFDHPLMDALKRLDFMSLRAR